MKGIVSASELGALPTGRCSGDSLVRALCGVYACRRSAVPDFVGVLRGQLFLAAASMEGDRAE